MIIDTLCAAETAYALRKALGAERSWGHFLSDCIREKTKVSEPVLLPVVCVKAPGDRCRRPRYAKRHVLEFILNHRATHPRSANFGKLQSVTIDIDEASLLIPWQLRKTIQMPSTALGGDDVVT